MTLLFFSELGTSPAARVEEVVPDFFILITRMPEAFMRRGFASEKPYL